VSVSLSLLLLNMTVIDIIRKKRDGGALEDAEIQGFVAGVTEGNIPDYQAAALLMAICIRGMDARETATLTDAMVHSGVRLDLSRYGTRAVDKHSTGGVGDKTSLIVAPAAAACGAIVPMMSGRGLGHTGGTLDKLESIPGFRTGLAVDEMLRVLDTTGCALIGQTRRIAPADRVLYPLRDVTGTVESLPLICASIMSKKIAEGVSGLVLDVKAGRGAVLRGVDEARALAQVMVETGVREGVRTEAIITRMDVPLGLAVGNALEVVECLEVLRGGGPPDLVELSELLAARMLVLAGVASGDDDARAQVRAAIADGRALTTLRKTIEAQGGDPRVVDDPSRLARAGKTRAMAAGRRGYVAELHADALGHASLLLGAGRVKLDSAIDPAAGLMILRRPGEAVEAGDVVLELHYNDDARLRGAEALARAAIVIADEPPPAADLVIDRVAAP